MSDLDNELASFRNALQVAADYANGDDSTDAVTPGGNIPSVAKQYKINQAAVNALLPDLDNRLRLDQVGDYSTAEQAQGRANLGLNLVDNTPDASKPVSNAQAIAIAAVEDIANSKVSAATRNQANGYPGLDGFRIALVNDAGDVISHLNSLATAARLYTLPDKNGTFAMLSDISGSNTGDNTGDETAQSIKTKLGISVLSGDNTGDETLQSIQSKLGNTGNLTEGANLYYTPARVNAAVLTDFANVSSSPVTASDSVAGAVSKLQAQASANAGDILLREAVTNKAVDFATLNNTKYPTTKATDDQITAKLNALALSGDISTPGNGSFITTIGNNVVSLAKMAQVATLSFLGRTTAGTGNVEALNATQVKSALALDNVNNTSDVNKPISSAAQLALDTKEVIANKATSLATPDNTKYPTTLAVKTAIDTALAGVLNDRGNYDASTGVFPSTGGSGTSGAVKKGDMWYVSVAGTIASVPYNIGDSIRALADAPGQTATNWDGMESNIGYVPVNAATLGQASGVATLGSDGVLATAQRPTTAGITEGSNLYFTSARVLATVLAGLSTATNSVVAATDTVLVGIGKLQAQLSVLITTVAGKASSGANTDITSLAAGVTAPGVLSSVSTTVAAAGTTQATATTLTSDINVVTTAAAGSGVVLAAPSANSKRTIVVNKTANALLVYPSTGVVIDAAAINIAVTCPAGGAIEFNSSSATQWNSSLAYAVNAASVQGSLLVGQTDKGSVTTGTVTFDASAKAAYKVTVAGAQTWAFSNWAATGNLSEVLVEVVNGGAFAITMPSIYWPLPTTGAAAGSFAAYLTAIGRSPATLQASGTDQILFWTTNGGTTVYGKIVN